MQISTEKKKHQVATITLKIISKPISSTAGPEPAA